MATIDYSLYDIDLADLADTRILAVFNSGCDVLNPTIQSIVVQGQEVYDEGFIGVLNGYTVDNGIGVQLNILGRIVGQDRELVDQALIDYFVLDSVPLDTGPIFVENSPVAGNVPATDDQYRVLIRGKIVKNHVQYGTIPDVVIFAKLVFNIDLHIQKDGLLDVTLVVPAYTPITTQYALISKINNDEVTYDYLLPFGTGVRIVGIIVIPTKPEVPFILDRYPMDVGKMITEFRTND